MKTCPDCRHPVSPQAYTCPNCGRPLKSSPTNTFFSIILLILGVVVGIPLLIIVGMFIIYAVVAMSR